jgi:beta-xylosidase
MSSSALNHFTRTPEKVPFTLQLKTKQKKERSSANFTFGRTELQKLPQQGCVHFCTEEVITSLNIKHKSIS